MEAVYVQTNDAQKNEIVAHSRAGDGSLTGLGSFETGGRGTGKPHLPSQSSLALSDDGAWLLVANGGSDTISLFAVQAEGLRLADSVPSGGGCRRAWPVHSRSSTREQRDRERDRVQDRRQQARGARRVDALAERRGRRPRSDQLQPGRISAAWYSRVSCSKARSSPARSASTRCVSSTETACPTRRL